MMMDHTEAMNNEKLYVINRCGEREDVRFDAMVEHVRRLCDEIEPSLKNVDVPFLARKAINQMVPGITTSQIDNLIAEESACMARASDDYVTLAGRIAIHNLHKDVAVLHIAKNTDESQEVRSGPTERLSYATVVRHLYENEYSDSPAPLISKEIYNFMCEKHDEDVYEEGYGDTGVTFGDLRRLVEEAIDHTRDYDLYTYFGIMTVIRKYLNHNLDTKDVLELPQHMLMTVSLGIHGWENLTDAIETYDLMSRGYFTHATPTLLNGGRRMNQMASCYLLTMGEDSLPAIFECLRRSAMISQGGGGVGISMTPLRARGSRIKRFNGTAHGVGHELLKIFNDVAMYVDQGGGKRKGAFAMYLEPWHADIEEFIDLRANSGSMDMKTNDLHLGLWINDLFMERVLRNEEWSLFCPTEAPKLVDSYGDEFEEYYLEYERAGKARKTIPAVDLWYQILDKQQEVSEPYMMYKDAVNRKTNQSNLGTIRGSNLCTEICEYTSADEIAVCMLMSFALPKYVVLAENEDEIERMRLQYGDEELEQLCAIGDTGHFYDMFEFARHVRLGVRNMNRVIDRMWYPEDTARASNMKHRPIGLGVQGLADVFGMTEISWDSTEASLLNREIFSTMYRAALRGSMECAKFDGPYESYAGSPASKGIFQPELWSNERATLTLRYAKEGERAKMFLDPDFAANLIGDSLKEDIAKYGLRNSLLMAPMPTATTAQILGNNECLTGDTIVTTRSGLGIPIKDMGACIEDVLGVSFSGMEPDTCIGLIDQGVKDVIRLTLFDGRTIRCTPNHKFLLDNGEWKEAQHILVNVDRISIGIEPVIDERDFETWSYMGRIWSRESALAFARIAGFVHADGTVSEQKYGFYASASFGTRYDRDTFISDLELLGETFSTREQANGIFCVRMHADFSKILANTIGYGKRIDKEYAIPEFVSDLSTPISIVREYLAGHFGGDGHRPVLAGSSLKGVKLSHYIRNDLIDSLKDFFEQVKTALIRVGVEGKILIRDDKPRNGGFSTRTDTMGILMELEANSSFSIKVGFRYCADKSIKLGMATSYWRHVETSYDQRRRVLDHAHAIRSSEEGMSRNKALERAREIVFKEEPALGDYARANQSAMKYQRHERRGRTGISPRTFLEQFETWNSKYAVERDTDKCPTFSLPVVAIKSAGNEQVWDISVEKTHAFFANGIAVHNCFEPFTSNMYTRATGAGDFIVYNKHLVHSLKKRGLWDTRTRDAIYAAKGSVQGIPWIPDDVKAVYKTVWEIKQSRLIRMAADRAPYIDQSMSLNLHVANPTRATLNSLHFLAWRNKLKTGSYYIRRLAESSATSFNSVSLGVSAAGVTTKRKHDEVGETSNGNGHGDDDTEKVEMKKARIVGACPLNSAVGETDASACDACSG